MPKDIAAGLSFVIVGFWLFVSVAAHIKMPDNIYITISMIVMVILLWLTSKLMGDSK